MCVWHSTLYTVRCISGIDWRQQCSCVHTFQGPRSSLLRTGRSALRLGVPTLHIRLIFACSEWPYASKEEPESLILRGVDASGDV